VYVSNSAQATKLAQLATATRYAGNGLIVIDAGLRVQKVRGLYESGEDWQREAVLAVTWISLRRLGVSITRGLTRGADANAA
jgi:hypothetical protein